METTETATNPLSRKRIAIRFLYTIFFVIIFELLKWTVQLIVLFQYIYLFITTEYSDPVRRFSNKLIAYCYHVMRYITLTQNIRPFPFTDFPQELDEPESEPTFD